MTTIVTTQAQLDAALAAGEQWIEINSERGVWLRIGDSGSATVSASGSATVSAFDSATVRASGSATVSAFDSATVRAFGSATVSASGSATVSASDSATVRAFDSATVSAFGSATVKATPKVAVHLHSADVTVAGGVIIDVSKPLLDGREWCEHHGVTVTKAGIATVFKAVDDNYRSGYSTSYVPGTKPAAPDWRDDNDCGGGLHFSPSPVQALAYAEDATRFLAVGVKVADLRPIPGGTAKCKAPRAAKACVEVDLDGNPVSQTGE